MTRWLSVVAALLALRCASPSGESTLNGAIASKAQIIGTWKYASGYGSTRLTFAEDDSCFRLDSIGIRRYVSRFLYAVRSDSVYMFTTSVNNSVAYFDARRSEDSLFMTWTDTDSTRIEGLFLLQQEYVEFR